VVLQLDLGALALNFLADAELGRAELIIGDFTIVQDP